MTTSIIFSAILCLLVQRLSDRKMNNSGNGLVLILILAIVYFLPLGPLTLAAYLRGIFGDLSSLLAIFLVVRCFHVSDKIRSTARVSDLDLQPLFVPLALVSLVFYPLALGLGQWDPYSLGYQPLALFLLLVVFGVILLFTRNYLAAAFLALALASFLAHLQESDNLWDYILDPAFAIVMWCWLPWHLLVNTRNTDHSRAR